MPPTLAALRDTVSRERRRVDRRVGRPDTRVFPRERRVGERRGIAEGDRIDEDMIVEVMVDAMADAAADAGREPDRDRDEVTRIRATAG
jgi:hypothetical protein